MDPASAIGVASSAITFVQFTYQFLSVVYTIYDDGRPLEHNTLEEMAVQMRDFSSQLMHERQATERQEDIAIVSLAIQCHSLAEDMVSHLGKAKVKKRHLGNAIKTAIKVIWSRDQIVRLQQMLDSCRTQLHLQVTVLAR
jgi:hypothetical protein